MQYQTDQRIVATLDAGGTNFVFGAISFVVFVLMSIVFFTGKSNYILRYLIQWVGIPAFAITAYFIKQCNWVSKALVYISVNCFGIYLLHMFFVQAGAMIITRLPFNIPSWGYIIYLIVSTTLSIFVTAWLWSKLNAMINFKKNL
mgnify:CR=1 FL=1